MPSTRALAVLDEPPPTEPINKALRITEKVRRAIGLMVQGNCKTISEAAERVGLARESLGRALDKPHVAEFLRQKVIRHLATQAARAGAVKGELLDSDNELVRDRASSFVLALVQRATAKRDATARRTRGEQPGFGPDVAFREVRTSLRAGLVLL